MLKAEGEAAPVLSTATGAEINFEEKAFLCRCGASQNKPFCDGAHASTGYSDKNNCANDALRDFGAPDITVHFNRSICAGASECVHALPSVFESSSGDWIHPEKAPVEEVIAAVKKCPSGALTYTLAGETVLAQEKEVSIRIAKNGPYVVKGAVDIDAPKWSKNASPTNFTLCRCGKSANAPFCDYSHGEQGWDDSK